METTTERTVNIKGLLIIVGVIFYLSLCYLGGWGLTFTDNTIFANPYSVGRSLVNAVLLLLFTLIAVLAIPLLIFGGIAFFNWLFPKKKEVRG